MTWIALKNGWRDESTEGPYTEYLQTKGKWEVSRLYPGHRSNDLFTLRNRRSGKEREFKSIEEAKAFADRKD